MVLKALGLRQNFDFCISSPKFCGIDPYTQPNEILSKLWLRPSSEKPIMIVSVGYVDKAAKVPCAANVKKPIEDILTVF